MGDYDFTRLNTKRIQDLLPQLMRQMETRVSQSPTLVLAAWSGLVGERISTMTQPVSFENGVLRIRVNNSTLYSLLVHQEKSRLLNMLRKQFPSVPIRDLLFRMG